MIQDIFNLQNPWRTDTAHEFSYKPRAILKELITQIENPKVIGLIGSRQVGKSSLLFLLIKHLFSSGTPSSHIFYFNLDDIKIRELFLNIAEFVEFVGRDNARKCIFIDEIQRLENPGLFLKELYDLKLNLKVFYSGSSQLEIKSKIKEYGTGRIREFVIERLTFEEYLEFAKPITKKEALHQYLVYGSYPEVAQTSSTHEKQLILKDIYQSYLEKDIVDFLKIGNVDGFNKLLILLANQIGGLLYLDALCKSLAISKKELEWFITVLEQTFIIKRIYPFFKNYKKEITKTPKMYFLDTGLRNFIINNFADITTRSDKGLLFENFYLMQLVASDTWGLRKINFWRTTNQTEIDFIIRDGDNLQAIETKYDKASTPKSFKTIKQYYPSIITKVVTADSV